MSRLQNRRACTSLRLFAEEAAQDHLSDSLLEHSCRFQQLTLQDTHLQLHLEIGYRFAASLLESRQSDRDLEKKEGRVREEAEQGLGFH